FAAGLVDALVGADDQAAWVETALGLRHQRLLRDRVPPGVHNRGEVGSAWGEVLRARAPERATGIDWAARLCESWTELRGADQSVRAGMATLDGRRIVVIANDRSRIR